MFQLTMAAKDRLFLSIFSVRKLAAAKLAFVLAR